MKRLTHWLGQPIDETKEPWYRFGRVVTRIDRHIAVEEGHNWLDVGCQLGQFLKVVSANYRIQAYGIDDFEPANVVEVCRKYFKLNKTEAHEIFDGSWTYYSRRIDKVGLALVERFRLISALEVIEHMVDTDAFIDQCRDHLETGGHLVISTPNINSLRNRVTVPLGVYPTGMEWRTFVHHVRLYNSKILVKHMESRGFCLIDIVGVSFLPVRFLSNRLMRAIDRLLSDRFPSFCGNLIAIFQKRP